MFKPVLFHKRWARDYYETNESASTPFRKEIITTVSSNIDTSIKLSQAQKFRKLLNRTQILASLGSKGGMKTFQKRYEQLETIILLWKRGEEVVITPEHDLNHFELGGKAEYIRRNKKESKEEQNENAMYDTELPAQEENSVNDMRLSNATDVTDTNNEDSREKLEMVMQPKMLNLKLQKQ